MYIYIYIYIYIFFFRCKKNHTIVSKRILDWWSWYYLGICSYELNNRYEGNGEKVLEKQESGSFLRRQSFIITSLIQSIAFD